MATHPVTTTFSHLHCRVQAHTIFTTPLKFDLLVYGPLPPPYCHKAAPNPNHSDSSRELQSKLKLLTLHHISSFYNYNDMMLKYRSTARNPAKRRIFFCGRGASSRIERTIMRIINNILCTKPLWSMENFKGN